MSEKKVGKRLLTWVLVLVMTLSLLPLNVLAASPAVMRIVKPDTDKYITYNFYLTDEEEAEPYKSQIIKSGNSLTAPATPEKEGYQFTGWFYQNGTKFTDFETPISVTEDSTDVDLYAKFVPVCYVYFMDGKDEGARIIATEKLTPESSLSSEDFDRAALLVPVSAEQAVIGWTKDDKPVEEVSYVAGGSIYLYPIIANGHWITFDSKGGSYVDPQFVTDTTEEPSAPTKPGYDFVGWYDGSNEFSFGGTLDSNKDLTAHWTEKKDVQYNVIHWLENADVDGYSYKESERLTGTAGELTEDAVDKSYEGFTLEKVEQKEIAGDGSTIVNVYYKRNMYTVTFVSDGRGNDIICGKEAHEHTYTDYKWGLFSGYKYKGGCYPSDKYSRTPICGKEEHTHYHPDCYGILLKNLTITAKYGANISDKWPTYNGSSTWKTSKNGDTYQVNIDTMPLGGATFYGPLTGNGSETAYYYVESLSGGNYELHHSDTSPGTGYTVSEEDKYPITGFTYSHGTNNRQSYNNAKFYYTRNSYDIVFIDNGQTVNTIGKKYQQDISDVSYTPTTPAGKEGYEFAGWYADPAGEQEYVFTGKTMPAQNITVYAKWVAPVHTVTFKVEGQEDTTSQVTHESTVTLPKNPTPPTGEDFLGWTYQDGKPFNPDTKITDDLTLIAKFGSKTGYTVTYDTTDGNGTSVSDDNRYGKGAAATVLKGANTAPDDKVFLYWTDSDNNVYYPKSKVTINGDVTLTAVYGDKAQPVSITYHSNFDTDQSKTFAAYANNEKITVMDYSTTALPTREGYTFAGWNTKSDGTGTTFAAGTDVRVDNDGANDLYALWTVNQYSYTVEYYYDSKLDKTKTESKSAEFGSEIKTYTDNAITGYKLDKTENLPLTVGADSSKNIIKVYYVTDPDQKHNLSYTVEYYKDGVKVEADTQTVRKPVQVLETTLPVDKSEINTTNKYNGYKFEKTDPTTIPDTVNDGATIKVYYVTDPDQTKTLSYTVEYYKDGVKVEADTQTVPQTVQVLQPDTLTVDKNAINTTDKYTGYKFDKTDPTMIPDTVNDGDTIKVYYVKDSFTVIWLNWNGDLLEKDEDVKYNSDPSYDGKSPTRPASGRYTYTFNGWTPALSPVTGDITYTATYKSTYHRPSTPTKPTVTIEDDDALGLNTTDHFAYIVGYGNGEVRPQNNITRAEVATIFFRLLTDDVRDENLTKTNRYSDVAATSWYNTAVSTLSSMGIITGYPDGTFRPNAAITRAEFAAIAARFDNDGDKTAAKFSDIATHWAKDEISIAYNNGWITGYPDGTFGPQRDITRAETMTLVNRVLNRQPETEDDLLPNMTVWTDNANPNAWYYLAVQEATNSHYYKFKTNSKYEKWTELRETRDWTQLEK